MTEIPKTQFTILQGILAHPYESPSLLELNEMNPSLEREEIQAHLQQLINADILEQADRDTTSRYRFTDNGRSELSGTGLFDAEATLEQYYRSSS